MISHLAISRIWTGTSPRNNPGSAVIYISFNVIVGEKVVLKKESQNCWVGDWRFHNLIERKLSSKSVHSSIQHHDKHIFRWLGRSRNVNKLLSISCWLARGCNHTSCLTLRRGRHICLQTFAWHFSSRGPGELARATHTWDAQKTCAETISANVLNRDLAKILYF